MTNRVTFFGALALVIGCSVAGYQYAAALYGEDIAALREDYASRSQALEEKYREKERVQHQSLVEAWEERDKALANVERLSDDVDRVRKQAADARSRLSASAGGTCDAERKQLARCADLLERGTELVRRGVELSERTAIDKDAMAIIVSQ
jgi:lipoprotein